MLEKTVNISGTEVRFRSSAAIPRLYRIKFKRDIFKDLAKLEASYKGKTTGDGEIPIEDLEIFENVAYVPITVSPETLMTGLTSSRCSRSMRCFRRFWSSGEPT